jgi:TNF receptor-associated factor 4
VYPDKAARREIGSLEVYCPHSSTGCTWTGPLSSVEEHAAHCPHKGVECSNPGCGLIMTAALLDQHLEECSYREVKCHHCQIALPFCQLAVSMISCASKELTNEPVNCMVTIFSCANVQKCTFMYNVHVYTMYICTQSLPCH